jgi:hypothetical protein
MKKIEIPLIGDFVIDEVSYTNPKIIPMVEQPILAWVWGAVKHITIPIVIEVEGASRALNLDNIVVDTVNFNPENSQDMTVLIGRIINRMNDFKPQTP